MRITMENCGNIEVGDLQLKPGMVNIKYGLPDTGKSVLARAIQAFIQDDPGEKKTLEVSETEPELFGYESLTSVACFDARFVARFVWRRTEREEEEYELSAAPEVPAGENGPRRILRPFPCNVIVLARAALPEINQALEHLRCDLRLAVEEGDGIDTPYLRVLLKKAEETDEGWWLYGSDENGEINKSLVLLIAFMVFRHYAVRREPSLILIDELDAEYSKNLLYIMMLAVFCWENGLWERTTLWLTRHRYIIADCMYHMSDIIKKEPYVTCMTNDAGELTETVLLPEDIDFGEALAKRHIAAPVDSFYRLLFLRRSLGYRYLLTPGGMMLDSLFRGLPQAEYYVRGTGIRRPMREEEAAEAEVEIQQFIPDFHYGEELARRTDMETMAGVYDGARSRYEKMMLYQAVFREEVTEPVVEAYLQDEFSNEEERMLRADPVKAEVVPYAITERCDAAVERVRKKAKNRK